LDRSLPGIVTLSLNGLVSLAMSSSLTGAGVVEREGLSASCDPRDASTSTSSPPKRERVRVRPPGNGSPPSLKGGRLGSGMCLGGD